MKKGCGSGREEMQSGLCVQSTSPPRNELSVLRLAGLGGIRCSKTNSNREKTKKRANKVEKCVTESVCVYV